MTNLICLLMFNHLVDAVDTVDIARDLACLDRNGTLVLQPTIILLYVHSLFIPLILGNYTAFTLYEMSLLFVKCFVP